MIAVTLPLLSQSVLWNSFPFDISPFARIVPFVSNTSALDSHSFRLQWALSNLSMTSSSFVNWACGNYFRALSRLVKLVTSCALVRHSCPQTVPTTCWLIQEFSQPVVHIQAGVAWVLFHYLPRFYQLRHFRLGSHCVLQEMSTQSKSKKPW